MFRMTCFGVMVGMGILAFSDSTRAADSALDLVPKDAAGFVHIRVNDVWKHDAFAPLRDYLTKTEPALLKEFGEQFGFLPADVDTLTLIYPSFSERLLVPPVIVVRTLKPYDKSKVVTSMRGMSAAQIDDWQRGHWHPPASIVMPLPGPKDAPFPNPMGFPPPMGIKGPPPIRIKEPLPPPIKEPEFERQEAADDPEHDHDHFGPRRPKADLRAAHFIGERDIHLYCLDANTLVFLPRTRNASNDSIMAFVVQLLRRQEKGLMDPALAQAAKSTAVIAIDSAAFSKTLPQKLKPDEANLLRPITSSKLAMLALDLGTELTSTFTFQAENADGARKIEDAIHGSIGAIKKGIPEWRKEAKRAMVPELAALLIDQVELATGKLAIKQSDTFVTATTSLKPDEAFTAAFKAGVAQIKVSRERTISQNNLKQIGIALHGYHDAHGRMPFPGVGKFGGPLGPGNNNPLLSWRVAILPFIEQQGLCQQFRLDEPWDSEHNKRLIERMPKVFAPVNGAKADKGHTFYQIFAGREALKSGLRFADFTDGLSNTIMVVESGDAVPWTRPDDMLYDAKKPLPKLGAPFNGDFNALFGDGSVRFIRKSIDEKILRALITIAGGEVVDGLE